VSPTADGYAQVRQLAAAVSNWGRWGDDDEVGTLNLIDEAAVINGSRSVIDGTAYVLGLPFGPGGPQIGRYGRFNPVHVMSRVGIAEPDDGATFRWSDDLLILPLQAGTQWDALAHCHYDGRLYNDRRAADVLSSRGAAHAGIDHQARRPYATRGVLLDVARHLEVEQLSSGQHIPLEVLLSVVERQRSEVMPGDAILIRTGFIRSLVMSQDRQAYMGGPSPGIGVDCVSWLHSANVSMIACDTRALEVLPTVDGAAMPVHALLLRDMGMPIGEMFCLEDLGEACAARRRWTFQLVAQPLAVEGGIGSPVNPVAIL
jgi:kynurenine formamidase